MTRATLEQLEPLAILFDAYRQFYGQPPELDGARSFLSDRLRQGESTAFLAVPDGEPRDSPVGFVQLYPLFTSTAMKRVWLVNDLFVMPEFRRRGIARALMETARQYAVDTGAAQLRLATATNNLRAKSLYEGTGYELDQTFDHYTLKI